jgi:hypothetical protein
MTAAVISIRDSCQQSQLPDISRFLCIAQGSNVLLRREQELPAVGSRRYSPDTEMAFGPSASLAVFGALLSTFCTPLSISSYSSSCSASSQSWSSASSSSSDDLLEIIATAAATVYAAHVLKRRKAKRRVRARRGGSVAGRAANRPSIRAEGARRVDEDYFCRDSFGLPRYSMALADESRFVRAFRMPSLVYESIRADIMNHVTERRNGTHSTRSCNFGIDWNGNCACFYFEQHRMQQEYLRAELTSALFMLTDGLSAHSTWNYLRMAESTASQCVKYFAAAVYSGEVSISTRPNEPRTRAYKR